MYELVSYVVPSVFLSDSSSFFGVSVISSFFSVTSNKQKNRKYHTNIIKIDFHAKDAPKDMIEKVSGAIANGEMTKIAMGNTHCPKKR